MSSPYGPDVLPQGRRGFGDVLSSLASGFEYGQRLRAMWNARGRDEEERAFAIRRREEADMAQPGAMSIGAYLGSPDAKRGLSARTIDLVGRGQIPERLEFSPEDAGDHRQTATGAVVSRRLAAEQSIAPDLERLAARASYLTPAQQEAQSRAKALREQETQSAAAYAQDFPAELEGLSPAEQVTRGREMAKRVFANAHPAPRRTRVTSSGDPRITQLGRIADRALARAQWSQGSPFSQETRPPGDRTSPGDWARLHARWHASDEVVQRADSAANANYQRAITGGAAPPVGTPEKTPQEWYNEVTREPAWAAKTRAERQAEATRRRRVARAATPGR
jgi:hypothetical protein